jgi:regulator of protease activity HflC (stomatin/prohibitin superfamily)
MRLQTRAIQDVELVLSDRRRIKLDVTYTFRVADAAASVRNVARPGEALEQLVETTLRTLAAPLTRDNIKLEFNNLERAVIERTREPAAQWGLVVESISLSKST